MSRHIDKVDRDFNDHDRINEAIEAHHEHLDKRTQEIAFEMVHNDYQCGVVSYGIGDITEHIYKDSNEEEALNDAIRLCVRGDAFNQKRGRFAMEAILIKHAVALSTDLGLAELELRSM